jgi:hypothetical protein
MESLAVLLQKISKTPRVFDVYCDVEISSTSV